MFQVRFEVLTAASIKMAVFWIVAQCSLLEVFRRFRGACCIIRAIAYNRNSLRPANNCSHIFSRV
jgi:hypothetical protein